MKTFRRTVLAVAFWTGVGTVFALPDLTGARDLRSTWLASLVEWWSWGVLVPAIFAINERLPFSPKFLARRLAIQAVIGPAVTIVWLYLHEVVASALHVGCDWTCMVDGRLLHNALHGGFLWGLVVYFLILGVHEVVVSRDRYQAAELRMERLERNYSEARLNALRMQLDPHFLFNALNTISAHVGREPSIARAMIEHLGDLLRLSLASQNRQEVSLLEELAFVEHYLAIQKVRFGDTLRVTHDIADDVQAVVVPSLILQPLVENAIRHGISSRAHGGSIAITARRDGEQLAITVADDGVGLPAGWSLANDAGIGLATTRERIAGLHPTTGTFDVRSRPGGGTEVEITFPFGISAPTHDVALA